MISEIFLLCPSITLEEKCYAEFVQRWKQHPVKICYSRTEVTFRQVQKNTSIISFKTTAFSNNTFFFSDSQGPGHLFGTKLVRWDINSLKVIGLHHLFSFLFEFFVLTTFFFLCQISLFLILYSFISDRTS